MKLGWLIILELKMSGECDKCGEHCLDCKCDIAPCPFCGSNDVGQIHHKDQNFVHYSCCICASDGPIVRLYKINIEKAFEEAKKLWNKKKDQ